MSKSAIDKMTSVRCLCLILAMCLRVSLALDSFMAEDGYEVFPTVPGSRYKLNPVRRIWTDALTSCQGDGGGAHLVIINSQQEADLVKTLFARITDTENIPFLFVGIDDIVQEGTWMTIQGGLVSASGYNMWGPGQPDNANQGEHCGAVDRNACYFDRPYDYLAPFLCEKPDV